MRNRPEAKNEVKSEANHTPDDAMSAAVDRWLETRRGRNIRGAAESSGTFDSGGGELARWRLYCQVLGRNKERVFVLWIPIAPNKHTRARLPAVPETATPELRARWSSLAAPKLFAAWHEARKATVVVTAKKRTTKKH